jgi:uncharacterized protein YcbX
MARSSVTVSSLHVYPIKSCRGIDLISAEVHPMGLAWDRRWMLVDAEGVFLSQRRAPRMATIDVVIGIDTLRISAPDMEDLEVPLDPRDGDLLPVAIWNDRLEAHVVGRDADVWFSEVLRQPCRLVRQPERPVRGVDPRYRRMHTPVPMDRFRPNIVVRGATPYAEDSWKTLTGPDLTLRLVKPCARCQIVTKDQRTGVGGDEPLRTLATYRQRDNKTLFGQNAIPDGPGSIRVDEVLTVG